MPAGPTRIRSLDIVRGYCLVIMTFDHLPQHVFSRFSNAEFGPLGLFTAASGFVFIFGIVAARSYGQTYREEGLSATWARVLRRSGLIYAVNTAILLLLFAGINAGLLAGTFWEREFKLVYQDPWSAVLQAITLIYRPGYGDILPMYVVFLFLVPAMLGALRRWNGTWLLTMSLGLWALAQTFPKSDSFNVLGYQLLFVVGFLTGVRRDTMPQRKHPLIRTLGWISLPLAVLAVAYRIKLALYPIAPAELLLWQSLTSMDNNGPLRVLSFALFAIALAYWWDTFPATMNRSRIVRFLGFLGKHSLPVFAWSVVATYVSIAVMPEQCSRAWKVMDALLVLLSLPVPALLATNLRIGAGHVAAHGERPKPEQAGCAVFSVPQRTGK